MHSNYLKIWRTPLNISSGAVFLISFIIYFFTTEKGASYWDCPEYITNASRLEVGHPPGNPAWMLAMRVATIPFSSEYHAYVINICSGILMATASFFICRILFIILRLSCEKIKSFSSLLRGEKNILAASIAAGGALCFSLCDSAWYSAVEAEVYAMSAMLTALALWIMTLWYFEKEVGKRKRLLILLAYLTGLSLGVHQLNLLCIPVYIFIILYRNNSGRVSFFKGAYCLLLSFLLIALILFVLIPGVLKWAGMFELLFVNDLCFPYNSGVIIFILILFLSLMAAIIVSNKLKAQRAVTGFWCLTTLLLGFSSFGIIIIRSAASPPMNEGNPSDIFALADYIGRDQYTSPPLIYGKTPYSQPLLEESYAPGKTLYSKYFLKRENPVYRKALPGARLYSRSGLLTEDDSIKNDLILSANRDGYLLQDYSFSYIYTPELNIWFPRITSSDKSHIRAYTDWTGMTSDNMDKISVSEAIDSAGNLVTKINGRGERPEVFSSRPTYLQNLRYFVSYQVFYMYLRYLLWNFAGRQNDFPSTGEIDYGNFITGIRPVDEAMLGNLDDIPAELWEDNPGHNNYYSIPFILGLIGILGLALGSRSSRRLLFISSLFFFMTGIAIVVYLNQNPIEARERDYSFIGSYMAFAMWIATGILIIARLIMKLKFKKAAIGMTIIFSFFPATLMGVVNFDDHNRNGRFETTFYATSLIEQELPSVIFTYGDNNTFPLWYVSEVLYPDSPNIPIDITYLSMPYYLNSLRNSSERPLHITADRALLDYGAFTYVSIPPLKDSEPKPLKNVLQNLYDRKEGKPILSSALVKIPSNPGDSIILNLHDFASVPGSLPFKNLMLLDIISCMTEENQPGILFFPTTLDKRFYKPLKPILKPALFGFIYAPEISDSASIAMMARAVEKEMSRLGETDLRDHYADPEILDKSRRYRSDLLIAADRLLKVGDTIRPGMIVNAVENYYSFRKISPGFLSHEDTTFNEGREYSRLLGNLYKITQNPQYRKLKDTNDNYLDSIRKQYIKYYNSLTHSQREKLSWTTLKNTNL